MLLDAGVVRDIADALDGRWRPEDEPDPLRRERLIAAARIRLYGERTRVGWYVVTYREARQAGLNRGDSDWTVGFLPDMSKFDDGPSEADVEALARVHLESGIEAEAGLALAYAVLYEPVKAIVTASPTSFRHNRDFDLPKRLEILSPAEAFEQFEISPGEAPVNVPPSDSAINDSPKWWVP